MSRKGIDYGEDHNSRQRQRCMAQHERRGTIYRLAENGVDSPQGGSKRGAEWIQTQDDAMTAAAEAWLRMGAALERNERADEPRPLNLILYSACAQAANTIARREKRYSSATVSLTIQQIHMRAAMMRLMFFAACITVCRRSTSMMSKLRIR